MKNKEYSLTEGNIKRAMIAFALPYLLSCFLQTFYGLVDMFVVGLNNPSQTTTAVSIGSQVMHMLTVMIAGIAMGSTVELGHSIGAKDYKKAKSIIGNSCLIFSIIAIVSTVLLACLADTITGWMMTPDEAVKETTVYLLICFLGLPFIIGYNVVCSIYRGAGDSKSPMIFVAIACAVNIALDFVFVLGFNMGAAGAALATVVGQAISVIVAIACIKKIGLGFKLDRDMFNPQKDKISAILKVGFPICMQDGLIQIAFIVITIIANSRGLIDSTSVGVVEKLISFMFLVPSAMLAAISTITAQNMGAGKPERAKLCLRYGIIVTVIWGAICCIYCQILPESLIWIFRREPEIIEAASVYLKAYAFDVIAASIHFCFSGYFCGIQRSEISFIHNIISVIVVRVPGAYLASKMFPKTLYPMGLAAPLGSLLSVFICIGFYIYLKNVTMNKDELTHL